MALVFGKRAIKKLSAIGLSNLLSRPKRFLPLPTNTGSFNGDLTYYQPGLGACGVVSSDNQAIVSISHFLFDSLSTDPDPNRNPLCGRKLRAERLDPISNVRRSVDLTVVDRCRKERFLCHKINSLTIVQALAVLLPTLM